MSLIGNINNMFKEYGSFPFDLWETLGQNTWSVEHVRAAGSHDIFYKALLDPNYCLLTT